MPRIKTSTIPEQVAAHLREGIARGHWVEVLPGRDQLAVELGVSPRSIQKAITNLEKEGLLVSHGQGRRTGIRLPESKLEANPIRVGILCFRRADRGDGYVIELRHQLEEAGHIPVICHQGLQELGMSVKRVARLVKSTKADAWVVVAGSGEVLQCFVDEDIKVFALAGRRSELPIAGTGPEKAPRYKEVVQHLIRLGHTRISFLCQSQLRKPAPSTSSRAILEALEEAGLVTGEYNLPHWEETPEGLKAILESLFQTTPPTALLLDEPHIFHAAYHFVSQRGLRVPQDVSMICTDGSVDFDWCIPTVAHVAWDYQPVVRRIMKWVRNVARGVDDRGQGYTGARYIEGGTVGPPPGST